MLCTTCQTTLPNASFGHDLDKDLENQMTLQRIRAISIAVLAIFFLSASPASAYLDPGTGSLLLQGVIGAIAGLLVALKLYWTRVKKFFATSQAEGQDRLNDVGGDE